MDDPTWPLLAVLGLAGAGLRVVLAEAASLRAHQLAWRQTQMQERVGVAGALAQPQAPSLTHYSVRQVAPRPLPLGPAVADAPPLLPGPTPSFAALLAGGTIGPAAAAGL